MSSEKEAVGGDESLVEVISDPEREKEDGDQLIQKVDEVYKKFKEVLLEEKRSELKALKTLIEAFNEALSVNIEEVAEELEIKLENVLESLGWEYELGESAGFDSLEAKGFSSEEIRLIFEELDDIVGMRIASEGFCRSDEMFKNYELLNYLRNSLEYLLEELESSDIASIREKMGNISELFNLKNGDFEITYLSDEELKALNQGVRSLLEN